MNPTLEGYTDAVLQETGDPDRLAADLAAIERLFAANRLLGDSLTDTAVAPPARRAVLSEILSGKVSEDAARAAAFAVGAVHAARVGPALDWLAHRAHRAAEAQAEVEPTLSFMAARRRVGGFAQAIFEELPADRLDEVEDELFRFARTVETAPALRRALTDRDVPSAVRRAVAAQLLEGKVQPATLRLVSYVLEAGRPRDVLGTLFWLVEQTAAARGWRVARVVAASEIDAGQRSRLAGSMSRLTGTPVEVQVTIDPELLSGVRIRIGDLQVDASARGRLARLREHLQPGAWEQGRLGETGRGTHEGAR